MRYQVVAGREKENSAEMAEKKGGDLVGAWRWTALLLMEWDEMGTVGEFQSASAIQGSHSPGYAAALFHFCPSPLFPAPVAP